MKCGTVRDSYLQWHSILLTDTTACAALGELAKRIAELEGALSESHALHCATTHRLLQAELLALKEPYLSSGFVTVSVQQTGTQTVSNDEGPDVPVHVSVKEEDIPASRGSLSIDRFGRTRYYGTAALSSVSEISALSIFHLSHTLSVQYLVEASIPNLCYRNRIDLISIE
jgi:hypothetical protein